MSLGNALGYLTILPLPYKRRVPLLYSLHYFSLVGAGLGSLAVLFFLGTKHFLPLGAACFFTVVGLEVLYGGTPLRGLAEMVQGRRTYPGHGFDPGFKLKVPGVLAVTFLMLVKTLSLATLPREWQIPAVFMFPILGRSAQSLAFVLSPHKLSRPHAGNPRIARSRVRAGLLSATLVLLLFLLPWWAALPALILFALVAVGGLRLFNKRFKGLTLQTVSVLAELSETLVLALLAAISLAMK